MDIELAGRITRLLGTASQGRVRNLARSFLCTVNLVQCETRVSFLNLLRGLRQVRGDFSVVNVIFVEIYIFIFVVVVVRKFRLADNYLPYLRGRHRAKSQNEFIPKAAFAKLCLIISVWVKMKQNYFLSVLQSVLCESFRSTLFRVIVLRAHKKDGGRVTINVDNTLKI